MSLSFPSVFALSVLLIGLWGTSRAEEVAVCQARHHPSYQVFAAQTRLPEIRTLENGVLNVGGNLKLDLRQPYRLTTQDGTAVAQLMQVPFGLLTAVVQKLSTNQSSSEDLAREFQTAVIDYKYLAQRWARYRPSAGGMAVKAQAVKCLETGDRETDTARWAFLKLSSLTWNCAAAPARPRTPGVRFFCMFTRSPNQLHATAQRLPRSRRQDRSPVLQHPDLGRTPERTSISQARPGLVLSRRGDAARHPG
jgi:hypothetical protein